MDDKQLNSLIESYYEMYSQPTEEQLDEGISFEVGSGDPNKARRQQKINKAADAGVPNAARKASGAVLPNMKLANSYEPEGEELDEKKGLWDNIHAKRKRGERPAKPGEEGYPKTLNVESKKVTCEECDGKGCSHCDDKGYHLEEGMKTARKNVGASKCWDGYKAKGTKKKGGKEVPNCVPEEVQQVDEVLGGQAGDGYIGHPRLGIKNPMAKKQSNTKTSSNTGLAGRLGNRAAATDAAMKQLRQSYEPEGEVVEAYDIVLEYLMTEGFTTNVEGAEKIMTAMSDEWLFNILEQRSDAE